MQILNFYAYPKPTHIISNVILSGSSCLSMQPIFLHCVYQPAHLRKLNKEKVLSISVWTCMLRLKINPLILTPYRYIVDNWMTKWKKLWDILFWERSLNEWNFFFEEINLIYKKKILFGKYTSRIIQHISFPHKMKALAINK